MILSLTIMFVVAMILKNSKKLNTTDDKTQILPKTKNNQFNYFKNKKKGDLYEIQIGKMYQKQGYKVYFKGINEKKKDAGIDLIAYKDNEVLLIQCKNWQNSQIKQEHLRIFLGDCTAYLEKEKHKFKNKEIKRFFITSCDEIDFAVKKFLEQNEIFYLIVPFETNLKT